MAMTMKITTTMQTAMNLMINSAATAVAYDQNTTEGMTMEGSVDDYG